MYVEYFRTIGLAFIIPIIFLYAFQQAASLAYNYWLSLWADDPVVNGTQVDTDLKLGVFGALGFAQGSKSFMFLNPHWLSLNFVLFLTISCVVVLQEFLFLALLWPFHLEE